VKDGTEEQRSRPTRKRPLEAGTLATPGEESTREQRSRPPGKAADRSARAALRYGRQRLGRVLRAPDDTPPLDAEVLLRHVLGISRAALFTHLDRQLTADEWRRYTQLLVRRAAGEPVAYLIGEREFMGRPFYVDRRVLIPRPETETLVESALEHLAPGATGWVADVGTGAGAIAVTLAAERPALRVLAIDCSIEALEVTRLNAHRLLGPAAGRVALVCADLLSPVGGPLRLIAANLPYIPAAELAALPPSVRRFEPHRALDGGSDGLALYRALLRQVPQVLARGGTLLMECDPRQAERLLALARAALPDGRGCVRHDLAGRARVVELTRS
jgi:release factor glutamine methyltransferase